MLANSFCLTLQGQQQRQEESQGMLKLPAMHWCAGLIELAQYYRLCQASSTCQASASYSNVCLQCFTVHGM